MSNIELNMIQDFLKVYLKFILEGILQDLSVICFPRFKNLYHQKAMYLEHIFHNLINMYKLSQVSHIVKIRRNFIKILS